VYLVTNTQDPARGVAETTALEFGRIEAIISADLGLGIVAGKDGLIKLTE